MLQLSSSEEKNENRARINQERSNYLFPKLTWRSCELWCRKAVQFSVIPITSCMAEQLTPGRVMMSHHPRVHPDCIRVINCHDGERRKTKRRRMCEVFEEEEAEVERAWRNLMRTPGSLHGAATSMSSRRQSGSSSAVAASSSRPMPPQSGSSNAAVSSSSRPMPPQSGSGRATVSSSSQHMPTPSGYQAAAVASSTLPMTSRSGFSCAAAGDEASKSMRPSSGMELQRMKGTVMFHKTLGTHSKWNIVVGAGALTE